MGPARLNLDPASYVLLFSFIGDDDEPPVRAPGGGPTVPRAARLRAPPHRPLELLLPSKPSSSGSAGDGASSRVDDELLFQLPPAAITFYGPCQRGHLGAMDFMPLGQGCRKGIIGVDSRCRTIHVHCDAAASSLAVSTMPAAHGHKSLPISVPVGYGVYVLHRNPVPDDGEHCFEALIHGRGPGSVFSEDWYWHPLPPPPHVNASDCAYGDDDDSGEDDRYIDMLDGHALVGGSHIWVSSTPTSRRLATYSFNTVSGTWGTVGDWAMPFSGRAEYVPELNFWLGFSSQDNRLCATDLAAASPHRPPELRGKWEDVAQQEDWVPVTSDLVPLGSGKLFIAKSFQRREKWYGPGFDGYVYANCEDFAVFAGVQLEHQAGAGLRMLKHKSVRYNFHHSMTYTVM